MASSLEARLVQRARIGFYRRRWTCRRVEGTPQILTPVLCAGEGRIVFGEGTRIGWEQGPGFHSTYVYIEARYPDSIVRLGPGSYVNNDVAIVSEGEGIVFGDRALIGPGTHVYDSDFHATLVVPGTHRDSQPPQRAAVTVGDDLFCGSRSLILKGSTLGDRVVIGAHSVIAGTIADDMVVAGNPARPVTL